jgi:hypothetical protein
MKRNILLVLVVVALIGFGGCASRTPDVRRVCGVIETVPEFGFVFVDGINTGNAPKEICFLVGYYETGFRTLDGHVRWASGKTERFGFNMNIDSDHNYTVFHPAGEGFSDAQAYADSQLKKRAIVAEEEAASAARQQAEAEEENAKTNKWNSLMNTLDLYKKHGIIK